MAAVRGIREGDQEIGHRETIPFTLDVSPVGSAAGVVTNPSTRLTKLSDPTADVGATSLVGASGVAAQIITLPLITLLEEGEDYRVDVTFDKDGGTLEVEGFIFCPARAGVG